MFSYQYAFSECYLAAKYSAVYYFVFGYHDTVYGWARSGNSGTLSCSKPTLGQCYIIPKISSKIKILLNIHVIFIRFVDL